jgi:hypothetical protein
MNMQSLEEIRNNDVVKKRLAKAMARDCFCSTKLEDYHGGTFPSSKGLATTRMSRLSHLTVRLPGRGWDG